MRVAVAMRVSPLVGIVAGAAARCASPNVGRVAVPVAMLFTPILGKKIAVLAVKLARPLIGNGHVADAIIFEKVTARQLFQIMEK